MRKGLASFASVMMITLTVPITFGAQASRSPLDIYLDGRLSVRAFDVVQNGTAFVPIWYVASIYEHVGGLSSWNGEKQIWRLRPSTGPGPLPKPNLYMDEGTGSGSIYVNGRLVGKHVPVVVAVDAYSHKKTACMPAPVLMELLNRLWKWKTTKWNPAGNIGVWKLSNSES